MYGGAAQYVLSAHKFTGKERDSESGLDDFGARYYASTMGRFTKPDPVFFQADMLTDPQRFNQYAYVRNNPLALVDPKGESIQLTGDAAQRQAQLNALCAAVGTQACPYLYQNAVTTTGANGNATTSYYVGVYTNGPSGEGPAFGQINSAAGEIAPIIADTKNVQLNVVSAGSTIKDDFGNSYNINARTPAATGIFGGNLQINLLDPSVPILPLDSFMMSNQQLGENTPGMVVGHELGHARGIMTGKLPGETSPDALRLENKVRTLRDPGAAQRIIHDCPPGACGSVPK
jgi:RHS repeat-associated protein